MYTVVKHHTLVKSRNISQVRGSISTATHCRGSQIKGYNPNPGGFEGVEPPHKSRVRYYLFVNISLHFVLIHVQLAYVMLG